MAAPTNISFLTATDLGPIGTSATTLVQTVDDAGTTYTVYFKFTAGADAVVIGAFGFGDLVTYRPLITPWLGPASAPTAIGTSGENVPIQFPVTAGAEYFLKIAPNAGNPTPAVLHISVLQAPVDPLEGDVIVVNDDTFAFPVVFLSSIANYRVFKFIDPFPNGEAADVLSDGSSLFEDFHAGNLKFYNPDFALAATLPLASGSPRIRTCRGLDTVYVGTQTSPVTVKTVTAAGAFGATTYTLTGITSLGALAASNDGSILYHADTANNSVVRRWDLVGNAALSNLAPSLGAFRRVSDILVLADDTIAVLWVEAGAHVIVNQYDPSGSILNSIDLGESATPSGTDPRMAYGVHDPADLWVWTHTTDDDFPAGQSLFRRIDLATGTVIGQVLHAEYEVGRYQPDPTATPLARFGPSFSCPFFVIGGSVTCPPNRRLFGCITPEASLSLCPNPDSGFPRTSRCGTVIS